MGMARLVNEAVNAGGEGRQRQEDGVKLMGSLRLSVAED